MLIKYLYHEVLDDEFLVWILELILEEEEIVDDDMLLMEKLV
jgi:hypothetical protein